jgi:hypothetical protein
MSHPLDDRVGPEGDSFRKFKLIGVMLKFPLFAGAQEQSGTFLHRPRFIRRRKGLCFTRRCRMNGLIYLIGLIVVIMFILSFLGLR